MRLRFRANPVGRPRKKGKKERKMNVDFNNGQSLPSHEIHQSASSSLHAPGLVAIDALSPPFSTHEAENMEGNVAFVHEGSESSTPNERLVMPKRPHNVNRLFSIF